MSASLLRAPPPPLRQQDHRCPLQKGHHRSPLPYPKHIHHPRLVCMLCTNCFRHQPALEEETHVWANPHLWIAIPRNEVGLYDIETCRGEELTIAGDEMRSGADFVKRPRVRALMQYLMTWDNIYGYSDVE
eukprot:TRINITY_DN335_c0_g1_i6.p1 TRINITY_DN335_c0_g1~~TRINITY_DN335_c0_g1_i6.p1  ORF type:complete len:131 (+),score=9.84 TRINITY_DN335_c0_g1_i6:48-440(+)